MTRRQSLSVCCFFVLFAEESSESSLLKSVVVLLVCCVGWRGREREEGLRELCGSAGLFQVGSRSGGVTVNTTR